MREIRPRAEPVEFAHWRSASQMDVNYGYALIPGELRAIIKRSLITEQRELCAYTGLRIDERSSHIEHLLPQAHSRRGGEDVSYGNMAACHPGPNSGYAPYGAHRKADWPSRDEAHLFVSPRSPGCEVRFHFDLQGRISAEEKDVAAQTTIDRLGLAHGKLTDLRGEAIRATLDNLDIPKARKLLNALEASERSVDGPLKPFCFALKQALNKQIIRLERIQAARRR